MPADQSLRVAVCGYSGAQRASSLGLVDLFQVAAKLSNAAIESVLLEGNLPRRRFDLVILPPSLDATEAMQGDAAVERFVRSQHRRGAVVCSVCAGAFLLAGAGLLDGRLATTHWGLRERFAEQFHAVKLDTQRILIDDGDIVTAGGVMAWVDLGLHLISRFVSPSVMLQVARYFVVDPGGREQRFYETFAPVLTHGDAAVLALQHWLPGQLGHGVGLDDMAREAKLTPRTLLRRFQRATGSTPGEYLQRLRTERARGLLETTDLSVDELARRVGYEDVGAFRRIFVRAMGLAPGEYRRRFRTK